jgi:hypothetical protein
MTIGVLSKISTLMSSTFGHSAERVCFRGAPRRCLQYQKRWPESFLRRNRVLVKKETGNLLGSSIRQSASIEWKKNHSTSYSLCAVCLLLVGRCVIDSCLSKHFAVPLIGSTFVEPGGRVRDCVAPHVPNGFVGLRNHLIWVIDKVPTVIW